MTAGTPSATALVAELTELLDLEQLDTDLYRGKRQPGGVGRVFGGQVIAQALQAAQRSTGAPKIAHSLHAYFMRPGSEDHPIVFRVVRDFEGRSFATRRVIAQQLGKPILNMAASFQEPEEGLHHQSVTMPAVVQPETLSPQNQLHAEVFADLPERLRERFLTPRPIDVRPVDPEAWFSRNPSTPRGSAWFRLAGPGSEDPAMHRAMLAYASDMMLLSTSLLPHGVRFPSANLSIASLDHAVWLHEPFRVDEWLLYATDSPWAGHGRGFSRGNVFTADGRLVASTAQEGMIRVRD